MENTPSYDQPAKGALSWGGEFRATFLLAAPLALANFLQMLTYSVDVFFIARLGEQP